LFYDLKKSLDNEFGEDSLGVEFPDYPDLPEGEETQERMDESLREYTKWLQQICQHEGVSQSQSFLEFNECSNLTVNLKGCIKYKEGILTKKSGGRYKEDAQPFYKKWRKCCRRWSDRWIVLTDQYLAILSNSTEFEPSEIMMIDSNFHVAYGDEKTGDELGIIVVNNFRRLSLKAKDSFEWTTWLRALKTAIDNNGIQSRYPRDFDSFAPKRKNNLAKLYICGEEYWNDLYTELISAEREVFITDWWMTPEIYLKRPVDLDNPDMEKYRLDNILGELARNGVKIYVLLWKEVEIAGLYNLSAHTKTMLETQSSNIQVIRHPRTLISFWSHHEKICVIDQKKAFVGGIDLCMGRFDINEHPLKDLPDENGKCIFPGKDYSNSRIKDFLEVADYRSELIERETTPRMPWQDIHAFVEGETAQDLGIHFIEYWNHAKVDKEGTKGNKGRFLRPIENLSDNMDSSRGRRLQNKVDDYNNLEEDEQYGVIGKDAIEFLVNDADVDYNVDKGIQSMDKKKLRQRINHEISDEDLDEDDEHEMNYAEQFLTPKNQRMQVYNMKHEDNREENKGEEEKQLADGYKHEEFMFRDGNYMFLIL
jgi:phosphatidylserine/phosphatidylglycerophosphate/cardiolipin synthase-like enzyme